MCGTKIRFVCYLLLQAGIIVAAQEATAVDASARTVRLADGTTLTYDRLVLSLVDGEELAVKEVAEMTGWSESKVKVQAFRARRRMREAVEKLLAFGGKNRGAGLGSMK